MKKIKAIIYSRVCGFFTPVMGWNKSKKSEYEDRKTLDTKKLPKLLKKELTKQTIKS